MIDVLKYYIIIMTQVLL